MRSREEWVDWLYGIAGSKALPIGPFADEILSAIAAERERAVEECAKVCDGTPGVQAELCADRIRRLNRQRVEGTKP